MKLTKSEAKIASIVRIIRSGKKLYYISRLDEIQRVKCKFCGGEYKKGLYICSKCVRGYVNIKQAGRHTVRELYYASLEIPWDREEAITVNGVKLSEIYLTEKGAKARAKVLNKRK